LFFIAGFVCTFARLKKNALHMIDLATNYMGFRLKNPLIVASSGLTKSVAKIKEFEEKGAAAVVLKSIFEEQIMVDTNQTLEFPDAYNIGTAAYDLVNESIKDFSVSEYTTLIREAKKEVAIPVIASINCVSKSEWIKIAKDFEQAGADGLELNIFIMPNKLDIHSSEHEKMYFEIIEAVTKNVQIPVALKLGYYFSSLVDTIRKFSWTNIKALVLFNRFFTPNINLDTLKLEASNIFSIPEEQFLPLRWIAMLSDVVRCDLSASTGIHDADAVLKQILAGATTTQICSTLYLHGSDQITRILEDMERWMEEKKFHSLDDFRGKLSVKEAENPVIYQRAQYMKHLSGME
jgi:dihydroorotate dehydrogenase (fumarate)